MNTFRRWRELLFGTFLLTLPLCAYADNCSSFSDCYQTLRAAIAATVGVGVLAALLSMGLDMLPGISTIKGLVQAITGQDLITGEELTWWERTLGVIPFGVALTDLGRMAARASRYTAEAERLANEAKHIPTRTSEQIGEEGMELLRQKMGYEPVLTPAQASRRPQGFDAVYFDPKTNSYVIGEAKGGYNNKSLSGILGQGYGYQQGTVEWAEEAVRATLNSKTANDLERKTAVEIYKALVLGHPPVRIEVFHTENAGNALGRTRHYTTHGG